MGVCGRSPRDGVSGIQQLGPAALVDQALAGLVPVRLAAGGTAHHPLQGLGDLADAGQELGAPAKSVNSEAMDMLQSYEWPGNVRQLVNATRRLTVTAPGGVITALDVPEDLGGTANARGAQEEWTQSLGHWAEKELAHHRQKPLVESALPEFEKTLIRIALNKAKGHRQEAARLLGWGRNTLTRKIRALDLD